MKTLDVTLRLIGWLGKIPYVGGHLARLYGWQPQYFNFALVGAVGVAWQYFFTWLLMGLGFPWWFAMAIGIFIAFQSNYLLNKHWVFS